MADSKGRIDEMAQSSEVSKSSKTPQKSTGRTPKPSIGKRLSRYLNDVRAEMRRVVWPTRDEVIQSSWIVVITLTIFVVLIFAFDEIASFIIGLLASVGG